jgi:hypothetical protein
MLEINNWFAQGLIIGIALSIVNLIFKFIKKLFLSKNPMTRYVTFYVSLIIAFFVDLLLTAHILRGWSSELIEKPLYIIVILALIYTFVIVRKNRIDKNKFIKISHNLIASNFIEADKQLRIKIDRTVGQYASRGFTHPPGMMFSEITEIYSNEISIHFEAIWNVLLRTIKTNNLTITTNLFKKVLDNEVNKAYAMLEKYCYGTISMYTKNETQTKLIVEEKLLEYERNRFLKKYEAEIRLLSNDKIFIPNHIS